MIYQKFLAAACLIIIFSITAINCQTENKQNVEKKDDYLTAWVKINEENLYLDLIKLVNRDSLNIPENEGLQKTIVTSDIGSYLGKFTQLIRKSSDSIEVRYLYTITNKVDSPGLKILLTVNYNKKYAKALDSVLDSSIQTKHFMVEKYEQPSSLPDIYRFQNGDIRAKNIRIEIIKRKPPYIVVFHINGKKSTPLLEEIQNGLHKSLLGEELMLKKVESVRYEFVDSLLQHLLSIYDARSFLRSP